MSEHTSARLSQLVSLVTEKVTGNKDPTKAYVGLEHLASHGSVLVGLGSATDSVSTNNVFRSGDTLFGKLRPQLRKAVNVTFDGYCSTDILVLRPTESANAKFVSYVLKSEAVFAEAIRTEEGTKMPRCSWQSLKDLYVFCPHPQQQRRIAEILSTLDETIEQTEALIAKYQQIKAGLMHDLFTRGVTPDGKLRPTRAEAPQLYKESPLGWIPKGWEVKYLATLYGNPIRDFGSFSSTNLITFLQSGVPFIKSEMIGVGKITWDGGMFISAEVHNMLNKSHVQKGDILFSKIGSALGKAVVYDGSRGVCNSNAAIAKIDVDRRKASNFFVMYFLNHQIAQIQFKNMIVSLLPRINLGDINRLLVPVPPVTEQLVIEKRLMAIDHALNSEEEFLDKELLTKHGLMHDLLSRRVRVKVDA